MRKSLLVAVQILVLVCFFSTSSGSSTQILNVDFESEDISSWHRQDWLVNSNANWALTPNGWNGSWGLQAVTSDCWPCTNDVSFLINPNSVVKAEGKYIITAKIKNTGYNSWNRPNGVVYSASRDGMGGYMAWLEHNELLTIHRYDSSKYYSIVYRTPIDMVQTNSWYNWVISYDPAKAYTKFEVYDLNGTLKGFIETYDTPYISDGVGFNVFRGPGCYDDLAVSEELMEPNIAIDPISYDFGEVAVGETNTAYINIANNGGRPLWLNNVYFQYPISGTPFQTDFPSLPVEIEANSSIDIPVSYSPSFLFAEQSNDLVIINNDPDEPILEVALAGVGVVAAADTPQAISSIQTFIDYAIETGSLLFIGDGTSGEGHYEALNNMLTSAGSTNNGCGNLQAAYKRVDGNPKQKDWVEGPAVAGLATAIQNLMDEMECK